MQQKIEIDINAILKRHQYMRRKRVFSLETVPDSNTSTRAFVDITQSMVDEINSAIQDRGANTVYKELCKIDVHITKKQHNQLGKQVILPMVFLFLARYLNVFENNLATFIIAIVLISRIMGVLYRGAAQAGGELATVLTNEEKGNYPITLKFLKDGWHNRAAPDDALYQDFPDTQRLIAREIVQAYLNAIEAQRNQPAPNTSAPRPALR